MKYLAVALAIACVALGVTAAPQRRGIDAMPFIAYVNNEAEFYPHPYTHDVSETQYMAHLVDAFIYGPLQFEEETFSIISRNTNDASNYRTLNAQKTVNPNLKVLFSVGGDHFPSHLWSLMVSSVTYRDGFVGSVKSMHEVYGFDGIEINWVYPCSPSRIIWEQFDQKTYRELDDEGGHCPNDLENIVELVKEIREELGQEFVISLAVGTDHTQWADAISSLEAFVDVFMIHAYNYAVSANLDGGSGKTAPAQPITDSADEYGFSVDKTVENYAKSGIPTYKMTVVVPAFGQAYYIPSIGRDPWNRYGITAEKSNACYGPYEDSYGAFPSDANHICGVMSYAEIVLATENGIAPEQDANTRSDIAFWSEKTAFISYTGQTAVRSLVDIVSVQRLGGVAINSVDLDTADATTGRHTYQLTVTLCNEFFGSGNGRCTISVPTTPAPGKDCIGRADGTYCLDYMNGFIVCPNNVTEPCPDGTVCKQNTTNAIACDWPTYAEFKKRV